MAVHKLHTRGTREMRNLAKSEKEHQDIMVNGVI